MSALKGLLKLWAVIALLIIALLLFVGVTPALVNADSNYGIPLMILMWASFVYCVGVVVLKYSLNKKEKK